MQRQRSILSFLRKPSPEDELSGGKDDGQRSYSSMFRGRLPTKQERDQRLTAAEVPEKELFSEVRGTDTPPEKISRSLFAASGGKDDDLARPFASISHKFARGDEPRRSAERNQGDFRSSARLSGSVKLEEDHSGEREEINPLNCSNGYVSAFSRQCNEAGNLDFEISSGILGPETPAMRPLVPRMKRIQEDPCDVGHRNGSVVWGSTKRVKTTEDSKAGIKTERHVPENLNTKSESANYLFQNHCDDGKYGPCLSGSTKRLRFAQESEPGKKSQVEAPDSAGSKFEWLNPPSIRDASGKRPSDPLYDKRTLYVPPDCLKKMSASQKQYWSVKSQYMDVVLFFKVGKFYELYELDAEIGQKELDWKMTVSGVGKCRQVGISEAGIDDAVQKLIARGYKVGRIEQLETSDQAKARGANSVIQRKLVHVYTPSTTTEGSMGPDAVHLLYLKEESRVLENGSTAYGFAFLDHAALKFWVGSICDDDSCAALGTLLMQVSPREVVYDSKGLSKEAQKALRKYASAVSTRMQLTPAMPSTNIQDACEVRELIHSKGYFRGSASSWTSALDSTMHQDLVICAVGGLIDHLSRLLLDDALLNGELLPYHVYESCLRMDGQTLVNLEIFCNNVDGGQSGTLYKYLDHCMTPSGKRLLRRWICHPLKNIDDINNRFNVVEELLKNSGVGTVIAQYLRRLPDLERLLGRIKASVGSSAVLLLPLVGERSLKLRVKAFGSLLKGLRVGIDLLITLQKEDLGMLLLSKVVNLPTLSGLDDLLRPFEVAMEADFPHYQDHAVRESDAETLSVLVELFVKNSTGWSEVIYALNCIDVLQSFAATANSSCGATSRPLLVPPNSQSMTSHHDNRVPVLLIQGLWHPYAVGENGNTQVPNDVYLGESDSGYHPSTLLLTGPNMGGKSTLLRATCLAVILAQLGCYVPCEMCELSPADIIFTRLGATDRIMSGESTFFVECTETASVLQNVTQDSLVLLDELGRGTSTFDGYAIAYAVFRHLVEKVRCRLLFATHYHPLTKEFGSHPHVSLQHMACAFEPKKGTSFEGERNLVFLYRLAPGACPESYGLQVALMAGIPRTVVEAASVASQRMKLTISKNFVSSESRSEFSILHEEWLKTLLAISSIGDSSWDEDALYTLLCLWHEMKSSYRSVR